MKVRDGHIIGVILCMQALGFTLCAMINLIVTEKIPMHYWYWMLLLGTIEAYNLYRLKGKDLDDEW